MKDSTFTIRATFMHTPTFGECEVASDALIRVDNGTIEDVCRRGDPRWSDMLSSATNLIELDSNSRLLPGLVDTHIHAPQWPQMGKALHLPLQQWLLENTFPLEARYADVDFARRMYQDMVSTLLANGTTTAVYFGTIHQQANQALAEICLNAGQRALVGKVAMDDRQQCPEYYRDASATQSIIETAEFVQWVRELSGNKSALVRPVVTPRFIPACTDALLKGLGEVAIDLGCHVQTHCSESDWAHGFVLERLGTTDTKALDNFRLLTRQTILAHSNFITDMDADTIAQRGAGIAHCPLSNHYFANSVLPLRQMIERGLRSSLGTDISGGPSVSMFESCRHAVSASRSLNDGVDPDIAAERRGRSKSAIDFRHAFWLGTVGGGDVLDTPIGKFAPGYHFDAMAIRVNQPNSNIRYFPDMDSPVDLFQKIVYAAQRTDIDRVWVHGELVKSDGRSRSGC